MITMSRLFRHALQKPWPETSACRDPMSFVAMPRAVGAHARPDDLTRSRLERRGEPCYSLGAGEGRLVFILICLLPILSEFFKMFFRRPSHRDFFRVSGQLQRRVRPPSPDRSPDRQRAPSRAFAPMAALREPALLNAWEGVRSCSQEMTVPPLCQTSRDHRRMVIVILRMIVPATGRVGETAIPAGCGLVSFALGEIRLSAVAGRAGRFRHECTSRMRRDIR